MQIIYLCVLNGPPAAKCLLVEAIILFFCCVFPWNMQKRGAAVMNAHS